MLIIENFDPYVVSTTYSKSANIKQGQIKSVNWGGAYSYIQVLPD